MKYVKTLAMLAAMGVYCTLAGCGGGGGGSRSSVPPQTVTPQPPPATGPAMPTASQARAQIAAIDSKATLLITTPLVVIKSSVPIGPLPARTLFDCLGKTRCLELFPGPRELVRTQGRPTAPRYGVKTVEASGRARNIPDPTIIADYRSFGGWLDHSFFLAVHTRVGGTSSIAGSETLNAFSMGVVSLGNPRTGSATWNGLMIALDERSPTRAVNGQAALTYDFGDSTMDVKFTNITGPRTYADMTCSDLDVRAGYFFEVSSVRGYISGTFYGDTHQEVGGQFERNSLVGAYGAKRQ